MIGSLNLTCEPYTSSCRSRLVGDTLYNDPPAGMNYVIFNV
jgi:hypothetical protein